MKEDGLRDCWFIDGEVQHAGLIRVTGCDHVGGPSIGTVAVVVELGDDISENWDSGDIIAFWPDGEHTCLDGLEFDLLIEDLFKANHGVTGFSWGKTERKQ